MTRWTFSLLIGLFALVVVATAASSASRARSLREKDGGARSEAAAPVPKAQPRLQPAAALVPTAAEPKRAKPRPPGYAIARVRAGRSLTLRTRPGGKPLVRAGARTQFGSARVLSVAEARGDWLGVTSEQLPNGKLGWVKRDSDALKVGRTQTSLYADLSRRTLELRVGRRVVKTIKVTVGAAGSPTPTGRFAVTDKLAGSRYGGYYGCCILALSGKQTNLPAGWSGGNRLAIHGTNSPGTIGKAASAGCLRAADAPLRTLMRRVPVGTPVFIRR